MIRFITRILMISTFFICLGAIGDTTWKILNPNSSEECEMQQIKVIRISNTQTLPQIQIMLPKVQEMPQNEKPIALKKVVILRQSEFIE